MPKTFFTEIEKIILKFDWKHKRPQIIKTVFIKNRTGRISLLNFRLHTTKLQKSIKQYGTGTETDMQINGTE